MARITKAELEQQIKELNEQINKYIIQLVQKDTEIFKLKDLHDNNYSETTLYIQQEKKIKDLQLQIKCHKDTINTANNTIKARNNTIETLQNTIEQLKIVDKNKELNKINRRTIYSLKDEIQKLKDEIQKLKDENNKLKSNTIQKIKNERGAGRKSKFTDKEKESIKRFRREGYTILEIATKFKCSVGLIHKLINEK